MINPLIVTGFRNRLAIVGADKDNRKPIYRNVAGVPKLAAAQSSINQIVAKEISGDDYRHPSARPGRKKA